MEKGYIADVHKSENVVVSRIWDPDDVRELCIDNNWYTRGTARAYKNMLSIVRDMPPTFDAVYETAADIVEHSDDADLYPAAVAFELERHVVRTFYSPVR